jgi:hypothetical protein
VEPAVAVECERLLQRCRNAGLRVYVDDGVLVTSGWTRSRRERLLKRDVEDSTQELLDYLTPRLMW